MPTSFLHQINDIVELIVSTAPQSILDVGAGFGKYGVLAREYLDLRDGREKYQDWQRQVDGIEIFAEYITPLHEFIYDNVYIGQAADIIPTLQTRYDLILLIDVIEHFELDEGQKFLQICQEAADNIIVSTPITFISQKSSFGNPHETHKSHWMRANFQGFSPKCFIPNELSLICYIGKNAPIVHKHLRTGKREIKRWMPFLHYFYRTFKQLGRKGF